MHRFAGMALRLLCCCVLAMHGVAAFHAPLPLMGGMRLRARACSSLASARPGRRSAVSSTQAVQPALACMSATLLWLPACSADVHHPAARWQCSAATCMSAPVNRRDAIAAAAVWQLAEWALLAAPAAAGDDQAKMVQAAVTRICVEDPLSGVQPRDLAIAVIDNGSQASKAAVAGVKAAGASVVVLKGDAERMQETYRTYKTPDADGQPDEFGLQAVAVIAPTAEALKTAMAGDGLACASCGFGGGSTGPKWVLVVDSQGKDDATLMAEGGVASRECTPSGAYAVMINLHARAYLRGPVRTQGGVASQICPP